MRKNILITGIPKIGKSTLLRKIIANIPNKVGFVTNEILGEMGRIGFEMETHLGNKAVVAHTDFQSLNKVSKYSVSIENLDSLIPEVSIFGNREVLYLDEISKIQIFSKSFQTLVLSYLNSKNTCICTIANIHHNNFIESILNREDIILVEISPENREEKEKFILQLLGKIEKAANYVNEPNRFIKKGGKVLILNSEHDTRTLTRKDNQWSCSCNFFQKHNICSHSIATEEFTKK